MADPLTSQESEFTVQSVYKFFTTYFVVVLLATAFCGLAGGVYVATKPALYKAGVKFLPNLRSTDADTILTAMHRTESMTPFVLASGIRNPEINFPLRMKIKKPGYYDLEAKAESVFADIGSLAEEKSRTREFFDMVQAETLKDLREELAIELGALERQLASQELLVGDQIVFEIPSMRVRLDELRNTEPLGTLGFGRWELVKPRWFRILLASLVGGFGIGILCGLMHSALSRVTDNS